MLCKPRKQYQGKLTVRRPKNVLTVSNNAKYATYSWSLNPITDKVTFRNSLGQEVSEKLHNELLTKLK